MTQQLLAMEHECAVRTLRLQTPRKGAVVWDESVPNHVQGIARVDRGDRATLILALSGERKGTLWFSRFALNARDGRELAARGEVVSTLATEWPHPGGLQACGDLLAVACEGRRWGRLEIYDLTNIERPRLRDALVLNGSLGEGASQTNGSAAGWIAFTELAESTYLLFVGGRRFATEGGWFYRYRPSAPTRWEFAGQFCVKDVSSSRDGWGPQSGAAFVGSPPTLITFGHEGLARRKSYRPRLRCYSLSSIPSGTLRLVHQPADAPSVLELPHADFAFKRGPNPRWGSTAFVESDQRLVLYVTARNPRPELRTDVHVLDILEIRGAKR